MKSSTFNISKINQKLFYYSKQNFKTRYNITTNKNRRNYEKDNYIVRITVNLGI